MVLERLHCLKVATFCEAAKVGKREFRAKCLNHLCYVPADLFLLPMKLAQGDIDINCDLVEGKQLGCGTAWMMYIN